MILFRINLTIIRDIFSQLRLKNKCLRCTLPSILITAQTFFPHFQTHKKILIRLVLVRQSPSPLPHPSRPNPPPNAIYFPTVVRSQPMSFFAIAQLTTFSGLRRRRLGRHCTKVYFWRAQAAPPPRPRPGK